MLSVVCWKWKPAPGYRSTFGAEQVNVLRSMVKRHYARPHRFICVTDDGKGIEAGIEVVPLWQDFAGLRSPHGGNNPACYRRLRAFAPDAEKYFGERLVSVDLDCVITGDLVPLWERDEDFVIWGDTNPTTPYNGSMWMLRTGSRSKVWTEFDPKRSPALGLAKRYIGSDQAWLAVCLGPNEPRWTRRDGVCSYRNEIAPKGGALPSDARIVFFHGRHDPWHLDIQQRHRWVRDNWR